MTETERKQYIKSGWDITNPKAKINHWKEAEQRDPIGTKWANGMMIIYGGGCLFAIVTVLILWISGYFNYING